MDYLEIFKKDAFSDEIKSKAREVIEQAKNEILNHPNFPILVDNYLNNFWLKRADKKDMFVFQISESDFKNIDLSKVVDALNTSITQTLKTHSFLELNSSFEITSTKALPYNGTQEGREYLLNLSKNNNCLFFFGEKGINKFIQGDEKGDNIFISPEDRLLYGNKFTIDEIKAAFEKYKNEHLTKQYVYARFFESKNNIIAIYGEPNSVRFKLNKNLLKNSPEKYLRDDLVDFLSVNVQGTFNIEMKLSASKKPIDIHTEGKNGKLYFFEVKWLGESKDADEPKVATNPYIGNNAHRRANDGVIQTLGYIEELIVNMNRDLQCGYLVIFDARNQREEIKYAGVNSLPDNLKKFHIDKFDKIDNLILNNVHPCD
jgi:hypothetical protein